MPSEVQSRPSAGCANRPAPANLNMVSRLPATFVLPALDPAPTTRPSTATPLPQWPTSTTQESLSDCMPCVRGSFSHYDFPEESWRIERH